MFDLVSNRWQLYGFDGNFSMCPRDEARNHHRTSGRNNAARVNRTTFEWTSRVCISLIGMSTFRRARVLSVPSVPSAITRHLTLVALPRFSPLIVRLPFRYGDSVIRFHFSVLLFQCSSVRPNETKNASWMSIDVCGDSFAVPSNLTHLIAPENLIEQ